MDQPATCPSCGSDRMLRYCPACGQARVHEHDLTLKHFLHSVFHELVHVDGRLWATFRELVLRPGQVALEYVEGRRTAYIPPFRFFLVTSVAILLLLQASVYSLDPVVAGHPLFQKTVAWGAGEAGMRPETFLAQCNARFQGVLRFHFLYLETSLSILVASLLWRRQRKAIGAHAVFYLYHAAVASLGSSLLVWVGARVLAPQQGYLSGLLALVWSLAYLWFGLRRFYGQGTGPRLAKVVVLTLVQILGTLLAFLVALLTALPLLKYAAFRGV